MCAKREAVGFLDRYLEFIAAEGRVYSIKGSTGGEGFASDIAKSHYSVETPRPLDDRRIKALGSIGGSDRDQTILGWRTPSRQIE